MVLTDPYLIKSQSVEPLHEFQVTLEGQSRILIDTMEGSHEDAKLQSCRQSHMRSRSLQQAMRRLKL
jgi:hypothetical protein